MNFEQMGNYFFGGAAHLFNSEPAGNLVIAVGSILCMWYVLYLLYKHKIFLKV
jgi:predicted acyltransferase